MGKTTITITDTLSCLTAAVGGVVSKLEPPKKEPSKEGGRSKRDVAGKDKPSFYERVKRTFN